jgi:hypothetical protein
MFSSISCTPLPDRLVGPQPQTWYPSGMNLGLPTLLLDVPVKNEVQAERPQRSFDDSLA